MNVGWGKSFLSVAWPTGDQLVFFVCSGFSVSYLAPMDEQLTDSESPHFLFIMVVIVIYVIHDFSFCSHIIYRILILNFFAPDNKRSDFTTVAALSNTNRKKIDIRSQAGSRFLYILLIIYGPRHETNMISKHV